MRVLIAAPPKTGSVWFEKLVSLTFDQFLGIARDQRIFLVTTLRDTYDLVRKVR